MEHNLIIKKKLKGIGKLYSGLGPTIVRSFIATGALFVAVNETSKFLNKALL